jgi:chemotaxis protein MotA
MGSFAGSKFTKKRYLDTLKMLYDLFKMARRGGLAAIESDIEDPSKSKVFTSYIVKDHHVRDFICAPCGPPRRAPSNRSISTR